MKVCPACGMARLWAEFTPNEHCGSPNVPHRVCVECQARLAYTAALDLAMYFATFGGRPRKEAA